MQTAKATGPGHQPWGDAVSLEDGPVGLLSSWAGATAFWEPVKKPFPGRGREALPSPTHYPELAQRHWGGPEQAALLPQAPIPPQDGRSFPSRVKPHSFSSPGSLAIRQTHF